MVIKTKVTQSYRNTAFEDSGYQSLPKTQPHGYEMLEMTSKPES